MKSSASKREHKYMSVQAQHYLGDNVVWRKGKDPEYPYVADFEGKECRIRLNNFPKEKLYTLIVDGEEIANFDDWPSLPALGGIKRQGARGNETDRTGQQIEERISEDHSKVTWLHGPQTARIQLQLKQYEFHIELYKFYLGVILIANVVFYVVTSGMLGIYLTNTHIQHFKFFLLPPIAMSVVLGAIFIYGATLWKRKTKDIASTRKELTLVEDPEISFLSLLLQGFGYLFLIAGVLLAVLWKLT